MVCICLLKTGSRYGETGVRFNYLRPSMSRKVMVCICLLKTGSRYGETGVRFNYSPGHEGQIQFIRN